MEGFSLGYLEYLRYQGGGQGSPGGGCLGYLGYQGKRAGEPGGVVSGVPGIPGARAGEPEGVVFAGVPRVSGAGRGAGVDGVFGAPGVPGESR